MNTWRRSSMKSQSDEEISPVSSQSDDNSQRRSALSLNPYADLEFSDGRRFRVTELRAYNAQEHGGYPLGCDGLTGERQTQNHRPRWEVEMEVQGDGGRSDNFVFWVRITWNAVRRGELERVGYDRLCDRPNAIFLLARECVWQYLQSRRYPSRFSSHCRRIHLEVE